jgi:hypothetical protein
MAAANILDFNHAITAVEREVGGRLATYPCPLKSFYANGVWTLKSRDGETLCEISDDGIFLIAQILKAVIANGSSSQVKQVLKDRWEFFGPKGFWCYVEATTKFDAMRLGWVEYLRSGG